jgi:hypothetical protein
MKLELDRGLLNLEEFRSLFLGICELGIPRRGLDSGKPGWPKVCGEAYNPTGSPVAEDYEGSIQPEDDAVGSSP